MSNCQYNWHKEKLKFITHEPPYKSLREFAEEEGISIAAVSQRAKKDGWIAERDSHLGIVETKTTNAITDRRAEVRIRQSSSFTNIIDKWIEQFLDDNGDVIPEKVAGLSVGEIKKINDIINSLSGGFKKGTVNITLSKDLDKMSDEEIYDEIPGLEE